MNGRTLRRLPAVSGWGLTLVVLATAGPLRAQDTMSSGDWPADSLLPASTRFSVPGVLVDDLPVDRPAEALLFQPGVTTTDQGELLLRGGKVGDAALYLDGVPVLSGFRNTPFVGLSLSQTHHSGLGVSPNAIQSIAVTTGPLSAAMGNGQSGAIELRTRDAAERFTAGISYETDEPFGPGNSFGLNRVQGDLSGTLTRGLTFSLAGLLHGQRSLGSGFGSQDAPIFVSAGVDTIVGVPSVLNDPFADTTLVPVYDFAVSRGSCEDFSSSGNTDIAVNYGIDCGGARTPFSTISNYDILGKLSYTLAAGSRLSLVAVGTQNQNRNFDYGSLYNTAGLTGNRSSSNALILGLSQPLIRGDRSLSLEANLSFQRDRLRSGPLSTEAVDGTSEPFGGFLIAPLDLRFDFDNFPVNEELVQNYRTNAAGSRRSPLDLENTAQYSEVDAYRNNAYGLYNRDAIAQVIFPESGGPVGLLTLYRENRTVGTAAITYQLSRSNRLQVGGEFTRYTISNYSHFLTSQIFSDVYIQQPIRGGLFVQDELRLGEAAITAGLRYDFFDSRARRWSEFPRTFTHPQYDPANPEDFFTDDALFPEDESHSRISPHIQASFAITPRLTFRGGFAEQAQVPDFRQILLGVNTDESITTLNHVYGTDLDFERSTIFELGVHHLIATDLSVDLALYSRSVRSDVIIRAESRPDPLTGTNQILRLLTNDGSGRVRGLDVQLARRWGSVLSGSLAYSYQDAIVNQRGGGLQPDFTFPAPDSRPHSVAGMLAVSLPGDWKQGSTLGSILRNTGLFTVFRVASGTPYTSCSALNVLSPDLCSSFPTDALNASRLPTFKQLDIRLTKRFGPGGRFAGYLDARNVLNFRNVLSVFTATGETESPVEVNINWASDSVDYASEAIASGSYQTDGSINLGAGQANPSAGCGAWVDQGGTPASPNCIYLIRAEERFGDGNHVFDLAEQRRASEALYRAVRGEQELTGPPRRVRIGLEVGF